MGNKDDVSYIFLNCLFSFITFLVMPREPLKLPYQLSGILDICSTGKSIHVKTRVLVYYKYDSLAVDCVKVFSSLKNLGFRFLQVI